MLALLCGLAILVAGAIQLIRLEPEHAQSLQPATSAPVGDVVATAVRLVRSTDALELTVTMSTASRAVSTPGELWALIGPKGPIDRLGSDCGQAVAVGTEQRCVVRFAPETRVTPIVAVFGLGDERAQWTLPPV